MYSYRVTPACLVRPNVDSTALLKSTAKRRPQTVLEVLAEAAENGDPCPSNHQISLIMGRLDQDLICREVVKLRNAGLISIKKTGSHSRAITIVATGKSTKPTKRSAPHIAESARRAAEVLMMPHE
jgi:hypothetical protein